MANWVAAALTRLHPGGWMTMILSAALLPGALAALPPRAGSAQVLPLAPRAGREATRVILRARKDSKAPLRLLFPFVLHAGPTHAGDREDYTPEASAVLRGGGDLSAAFG